MVKKVLLGLAVVLAAFAAFVSTRSDTFRIERSTRIDAPADVAFAQVNDFHAWEAWSPWAKVDPAMKQSYEGPAAGVGAGYAWEGNDKAGKGKMTITESRAPQRVAIKLDFLEPFAATHAVEFAFKPAGEGKTDVSWTMTGNKNFLSKAMCVFMDMDAMIGPDFEKGLAGLKRESEARKPAEVARP